MTDRNAAALILSNPLVPLPAPFTDDRGKIQTLVQAEINSVQVITSKAGSVRANHWHRADSHYMYIVSGAMNYYHRAVGSTQPPELVTLRAGELVYTPSNVEHAAEFPEDCVFLNITTGPRDQKSYEADLVRIELIKPKS
jgi:quercetin dioxygenase-like cupin family protein